MLENNPCETQEVKLTIKKGADIFCFSQLQEQWSEVPDDSAIREETFTAVAWYAIDPWFLQIRRGSEYSSVIFKVFLDDVILEDGANLVDIAFIKE